MMRTLSPLLLGSLCLALLVACGDGEEATQIRDGLDQAWDGLKAWSVKERAAAETAFDEALAGLEDDLDAAKRKAAEVGTEASGTLDAKWQDVSQKLEELKAAGAEDWEKAQSAFQKAYEAFRAEMEKEEEG